jgi:hypothetical protein
MPFALLLCERVCQSLSCWDPARKVSVYSEHSEQHEHSIVGVAQSADKVCKYRALVERTVAILAQSTSNELDAKLLPCNCRVTVETVKRSRGETRIPNIKGARGVVRVMTYASYSRRTGWMPESRRQRHCH